MGLQGLLIFLSHRRHRGLARGRDHERLWLRPESAILSVGIVGAFVAGLVLPAVGVSIGGGIVGSIIHATIGAVILLFLIRARAKEADSLAKC